MKQSDIFVLDECEITVDKQNYTLNTKWIYTIWESQKVLLCAPLSPTSDWKNTVIIHYYNKKSRINRPHRRKPLTFDWGVGRRSFDAQVPRRVSLVGEVPHLKVADGEADDGGLVQLAGDGAGERKHLCQLVELKVFLPPARASGVTWLLLP